MPCLDVRLLCHLLPPQGGERVKPPLPSAQPNRVKALGEIKPLKKQSRHPRHIKNPTSRSSRRRRNSKPPKKIQQSGYPSHTRTSLTSVLPPSRAQQVICRDIPLRCQLARQGPRRSAVRCACVPCCCAGLDCDTPMMRAGGAGGSRVGAADGGGWVLPRWVKGG